MGYNVPKWACYNMPRPINTGLASLCSSCCGRGCRPNICFHPRSEDTMFLRSLSSSGNFLRYSKPYESVSRLGLVPNTQLPKSYESLTWKRFASGRTMGFPKRTKFRKYFKGRVGGIRCDGSDLAFGKFGIKACEAGRISSKAIEATRRVMNRKFQGVGRIWIRIFADIPVTSKPAEVRMGKGKGNPSGWIARVMQGQMLFEMDGVSVVNAQQAARLAGHKLCLPIKFVKWP